MITFKRGDLFDDDANALVIPVNCVGVMGKGVALECKNSHPRVYKHYRALCDDGELIPGTVVHFGATTRTFYLFATKDHWRDDSRLGWILEGLSSLNFQLYQDRVRSVALPALGCGAGGLAWDAVKPAIEHYMNIDGVDVRVYEPMEKK